MYLLLPHDPVPICLVEQAKPQAGAVRIECEDDLWRHYSIYRGWEDAYTMQDNTTCVHPPKASETIGPPGWGGSYKGMHPRCAASHDLNPKAQPGACDYKTPYSTAESFEPWGREARPHHRCPHCVEGAKAPAPA